METTFDLVFSEQRTLSSSILSKCLNCSLDDADKIMYQFYEKNKDNLQTFFLVIRKDGATKVAMDYVSERNLNCFLNSKEYADSILNLKIAAFADIKKGAFDLKNIYNAEEADRQNLNNFSQNVSENDIKQLEPHIKRLNISSLDETSQIHKKASTQISEKPKIFTNPPESQNIKNQPAPIIKILPLIEEETAQNNSGNKKRKGGAIDDISQEVGHDKDLKKVKLTSQSNEKNAKTTVIEIEDDDGEPHSGTQTREKKKRGGKTSRGKASNGSKMLEEDEDWDLKKKN